MIIKMYVTLMSVIIAGILNMLYTKTKIYSKNNSPIDGGKYFYDGKRIFGENKTWNGFWGMVFFSAASQLIWGIICSFSEKMTSYNQLYTELPNSAVVNLGAGVLFGFAYVICELPNSFIKRRLNIIPGKRGSGIIGIVFFIIDQIDSLLGVVLMLSIMSPISFKEYWFYIITGAVTHIAVNLLLYAIKMRKNI